MEAARGPMTAKGHIHKESSRAGIQFQICLLSSRATSNKPTLHLVFPCIDGYENRGSEAGTLKNSDFLATEKLKGKQQTLSSLVPCSNPMSQAAQL